MEGWDGSDKSDVSDGTGRRQSQALRERRAWPRSELFSVRASDGSGIRMAVSEDKSAFVAQAFHPSFGNEVVTGRIVCDRWRLRFESEAATVEMPLPRLQIEMDEGAEGRICFSDPEQPEWSVYTFDAGILKHGPLQQQAHTRNQIRELRSRGEFKRALRLTLVFLGGFAALALAVSILVGVMVRSLVAKVPPAWEEQLGEAGMEELRLSVQFVENPKLQAKLDQAVAPLLGSVPTNGLNLRFYLMQHWMPNALALPGGQVVVTTDLLELADRPEEIAGVVAHELAHVTQKHALRKIISSAGPYLVCRLFMRDGSGLLGVLAGGSGLLVQQSFSQEYELEADAVGWDYLVKARIDPRGLTDMLRKLKAVQESRPELSGGIQAFSSHPATEKRIKRLEAKWRKLQNKSGFIDYNAI